MFRFKFRRQAQSSPVVREFLYVDVERARSLLAQMAGGIVESVVSRSLDKRDADATASVLGVGLGARISRESGREESRSLQDLAFASFEAKADAMGFIRELGPEIHDPAAWESGAVHSRITSGEIVRLTCDIQMLDPQFFQARLQRTNDFFDAMVALNTKPSQPGTSKSQIERVRQERRRALWNQTDPEVITKIGGVIQSLLGDAIAARMLPCGEDRPEFGFGAALLGRRGYIQEEREALFSQYGTVLKDWRVVMQVTMVPENETAVAIVPDFAKTNLVAGINSISRPGLERIAVQLLQLFESLGIAEGPRWPAISVIPLGIYRHVPRAPD